MIRYKKASDSIVKKNQINFLVAAGLIYLLGASDFFVNYGADFYPFGFVFATVVIVVYAYAIVKYHLMDVRIAIARGVIFVFVYAFVLGIPFLFSTTGLSFLIRTLGVHWLTYYTFFSLLLASSGPILYNILRTRTENKLLAKQRAYQQYIITMSQQLVRHRNRHDVAKLVKDMLLEQMEVESAYFFYYDPPANEFVTLGCEKEKETRLKWDDTTPILLAHTQKLMHREDLDRDKVKEYLVLTETNQLLERFHAVLLVPFLLGKEVFGFLCLGPKKDKSIYSEDDIHTLKLLANETALALENVHFYNEIQQHEHQLVQTAKLGSLGEMAAGFAHQINNPLQVITGAKQVLEHKMPRYFAHIKQHGMTEEIEKKMTTCFDVNLERIYGMGMRIRDIINSIRRYTEKTDYTQEEVKKLVQNGVAMIPESKLKLAHVKVVQNIPENIPTVSVKAIDIEQVVMNLCTNAIEAMEQQGEGNITIDAREADEKGYVAIAISDTGCGIPEEIRERIFDPFFTTKGAQGTGLGLSVVHTIIKDNQGQITCKSSLSNGTTFTVLLPIIRTQNQGGTNDERTREERKEKGADH